MQVHPGRGFSPDFFSGLFQKGQKAGALPIDLGRRTRVVEGDYRRQNTLTRALREYGRLVKTIFILRYLESEQLRRRINTQLNKGESLHSPREFLFFANRGKVRRRQEDEQVHQAVCLNPLTNCVIAWNTVYMAAADDRLRIDGHPVQESDLSHLSHCRYEHINPYGKYAFEVGRTSVVASFARSDRAGLWLRVVFCPLAAGRPGRVGYDLVDRLVGPQALINCGSHGLRLSRRRGRAESQFRLFLWWNSCSPRMRIATRAPQISRPQQPRAMRR